MIQRHMVPIYAYTILFVGFDYYECIHYTNLSRVSRPCISGSSCSKLTMSLVNDSLKFTSIDTQICWNFLLKNVSSFCSAKATHIFSAKNIRILYIESAKTVNEMTLNKLVKLTTLWTTGPRYICGDIAKCFTNILEKVLDAVFSHVLLKYRV